MQSTFILVAPYVIHNKHPVDEDQWDLAIFFRIKMSTTQPLTTRWHGCHGVDFMHLITPKL